MWILLTLISALCLGFYDIFKKISVRANNVLVVLMLNTVFGTLLMSPVIISNLASGHWGLGDTLTGHLMIVLKALIVLSSWILGYYALKHLPLTIQGPINATRPVVVLVDALLIFCERRKEFNAEPYLRSDMHKSGFLEDHVNTVYPQNNLPTHGLATIKQWQTARDFVFNMDKMFMPIPEDELIKNPACDQNPGY